MLMDGRETAKELKKKIKAKEILITKKNFII